MNEIKRLETDKWASAIIQYTPFAIIAVDNNFQIIAFNPAAEILTGISQEEAMGKYCGEVLRGSNCDTNSCAVRQALLMKRNTYYSEVEIHPKPSPVPIPVRKHTVTLLDEKGELMGALEILEDLREISAHRQEQEKIIYSITHDMKSPVTVIGGFVNRLKKLHQEKTLTDEKIDSYLSIIDENVNKLEDLILGFLNLSRFTPEFIKNNLSPYVLDNGIEKIVSSLKGQMEEKDIAVNIKTSENPFFIMADSQSIECALENLVTNAIKYSNNGGEIEIASYQKGNRIILDITDDGIGIPEEDRPHIFEPFYRGGNIAKSEGSGLGLANVANIIKAHDGEISVSSKEGEGATFSISLPMSDMGR